MLKGMNAVQEEDTWDLDPQQTPTNERESLVYLSSKTQYRHKGKCYRYFSDNKSRCSFCADAPERLTTFLKH